MNTERILRTSLGHLVRGILNDLKRRPEDAARELGIPLNEVEAILANQSSLRDEFIQRACAAWPVNPRDFATIVDDAPDGVLVMREEASRRSSRVMNRKQIPYYEYRDTACSRVSSFRPEWIAELHVVDDNDPHNPTVQWNNGHFMHQFTYFIGPVNFYYYNDQGEKDVAIMNTGDTMYISPFVQHTFATRDNNKGQQGLILALTFGNNLLGDAQHELGAITAELSKHYAVDTSTPAKMTGRLIRYHMDCLSLTEQALAHQADVDESILNQILEGNVADFNYPLLRRIASVMSVNLRELLGHDESFKRVEIRRYDHKYWGKAGNGYRIRQLACTPLVPFAKAVEIKIKGDREVFYPDFRFGLHQYLYNIGESDVLLRWRLGEKVHEVIMKSGDSVYMKPFVEHQFGAEEGNLLSLRIQSKVSGDCMRELSYIGAQHISRIIAEDLSWFTAI